MTSSAVARRSELAAKRAIDMAVAGAGLVILSPVLCACALAIRVKMGRPIFFTQERPGWREQPFRLRKFRTMRPPANGMVDFRADADRLTPLGRLLRKTSLDELPELWQVLRGEMSLVGPRPLLMDYLPLYSADQHRRHDVRPGITGWAVVNGRQAVPLSERFKLDVWYVDHWSLGLDLRILAMTARDVVKGKGVISGQSFDEVDDLGFLQSAYDFSGGPAGRLEGAAEDV